MGLLGFGGDQGDSYQPMPELSAAYMLNRKLLAGFEYRRKPHNLGVDREKAYADVFIAWFPSKQPSVTAAYARLGTMTAFHQTRQRHAYVSVQSGL